VRKWLLVMALSVGLGLILLVWLGMEDAREAALLDARVQDAEDRFGQAFDRRCRLIRNGAPEWEIMQARVEEGHAWGSSKPSATRSSGVRIGSRSSGPGPPASARRSTAAPAGEALRGPRAWTPLSCPAASHTEWNG
jgi:hypothetical protein